MNPLTKKIHLFSCFPIWLVLFLAVGCQSGDKTQSAIGNESQKIEFVDYPDLKLGFTTQNFLKVMPVTLENSKKLVDYAAEQGFAWLELRDPDAILTLEESKEIADYARERDLEIIYAIQKGLLDHDFWPTFDRTVKNAAVFDGPGVVRSLTGNTEFTNDENKKGWSQEELERIVLYADSAAGLAKNNDLQYVIENGLESFFGRGSEQYGVADVLSRLSENVGWQFDTANPFSVSRAHASADSVINFLQEHSDKLYYVHLKSSQNGVAQPTLTDNPLAFRKVFQILAAQDIPYVAIELQAVESQDQAYENMSQSIDYLVEEGYIKKP